MAKVNFFKAVYKGFNFWLRIKFYGLHFKRMKRRANRLWKLTGKQYFVIPLTETSLIVVDNSYIKEFNKIAHKNSARSITHKRLLEMCYYKTPVGKYNNR